MHKRKAPTNMLSSSKAPKTQVAVYKNKRKTSGVFYGTKLAFTLAPANLTFLLISFYSSKDYNSLHQFMRTKGVALSVAHKNIGVVLLLVNENKGRYSLITS